MKNSLEYLPSSKQSELKRLLLVIRENCRDVEKIILFGSYARGDYKEWKDLKPNRKSGHVSDYDILAVTEKKEVALDVSLWGMISEKCRRLGLSADPRIITHDIFELNCKLALGQYFYSDIAKEGILLYDSGRFELVQKAALEGKRQAEMVRENFDEGFSCATDFFDGFEFFLNKGSTKRAAFNLHQAAEHAYKTLLIIFTNYIPNEHFLEVLAQDVASFHPAITSIFPKTSEAEKERFRLLEYAYIGGRYDPKYQISKVDLEILSKEVKKLLDLTKELCEKKILLIAG